jgi:hypothetical protein
VRATAIDAEPAAKPFGPMKGLVALVLAALDSIAQAE